ncbi:uncharacterized protein K441DRAFT_667821 [Cenococcum geophilum 1.58]|uniref:uncharacterized protein n=1 Tax=Cenococcum geophilum 1.58 TaxID=794803 RepID=UPI00358FCF9F|nr:hypothetical protein K441DRAFT_667821 [Cenococcum geophilum 1.58]
MRPKPTPNEITPKKITSQKITSPEHVEGEKDSPVLPPADSYNKAHDFITGFNSWRPRRLPLPAIYEKNFATQMSTKEWMRFSDELNLSESDDRYPRYSFNSATSTLIIQCMPSAIHESMQFCFEKAIVRAEADLPLDAQCVCVQGQEMDQFEGQYYGSTKTADLAVRIINDRDQLETKLVVEIGFSEEYDDLVEDVKLWLEGMRTVSMCVLVNLEEEPKYSCPVDNNMDEKRFRELVFPDNPLEVQPEHIHLEGPFGPATYKGLEEVDHEGPDHEEPNNEEHDNEESDHEGPDNEEPDNEKNLHTARNINFKRSDFMDTTSDDDRAISIKGDEYRQLLARNIRELAAKRCRAMLKDRAKRADDPQDKDYMASKGKGRA